MNKTRMQHAGEILRRIGSWIEKFGTKTENSKGLGDLVAAQTEATKLDLFAEWLAVDILGREGCGCPARKNRLNTLWPFTKPKLAITIPEYNDRGGLWGMLHSLASEIQRYKLQDYVEIIVVTQTPTIIAPERHVLDFGTPQQKEMPPIGPTVVAGPEPLKTICDSFTARGIKVHYREFTGQIGTGPAKRACVRFAAEIKAEWMWICDSHLHFVPGSIHRFWKWVCKTKNRNSKHLYHCPLLYDDAKGAYTGMETRKPNKLALIGGDHLWGQFRSEIKLLTEESNEMEIQAHGGFFFATRVDIAAQTFGHELFRGFGDPETILHEQRRAAGFKVYCLPARIISCWHRFLKVRHNDYHSPWTDALRNHLIGALSLRLHLMREAMAAGFDEPFEWVCASWADSFPDRKQTIAQVAMNTRIEYDEWKAKVDQIRVDAMKKQIKQQTPKPAQQDDIQTVFSRIYQNAEWGKHETVSGPGSTLASTEKLRPAIIDLIHRYGFKSVLDIPCGDFNWMSRVVEGLNIQYIGADIAPGLVNELKKRYPEIDFRHLDITKSDLPASDIAIVRDCLVHLPVSLIKQAIQNLKRCGVKYVLATTFPGRELHDIQIGAWRPIDMQNPGIGMPEPLELINEGCTEGGGEYKDKSLGLWKL